jgi:hypothetical protein
VTNDEFVNAFRADPVAALRHRGLDDVRELAHAYPASQGSRAEPAHGAPGLDIRRR